jgi:hypothetical protein
MEMAGELFQGSNTQRDWKRYFQDRSGDFTKAYGVLLG